MPLGYMPEMESLNIDYRIIDVVIFTEYSMKNIGLEFTVRYIAYVNRVHGIIIIALSNDLGTRILSATSCSFL